MTHDYYNRANFPRVVVNHGPWDICANGAGHCAAIPTDDAAARGYKASTFGDLRYVAATLDRHIIAAAQTEFARYGFIASPLSEGEILGCVLAGVPTYGVGCDVAAGFTFAESLTAATRQEGGAVA